MTTTERPITQHILWGTPHLFYTGKARLLITYF
jgi:hypothetical protein